MRQPFAAAIVLLAAAALLLRAEDPPPRPSLDTIDKKAGYAMGFNLGSQLRKMGATIDADAVALGIRDGVAGTAPIMSTAAMQAAVAGWEKQIRDRMMKAEAEKSKKTREAGAAFLEKNRSAEGVKTTASGLQYKVVKQGDGPRPAASDFVSVHYEGTLIDGTVFDSSYRRGRAAEFPLNGVIKGWTEGVQLMPVGSTYMFYVPPDLAYGDQVAPGGEIPPGSTLIFKIELLEIKKR